MMRDAHSDVRRRTPNEHLEEMDVLEWLESFPNLIAVCRIEIERNPPQKNDIEWTGSIERYGFHFAGLQWQTGI
jgi:hypothetical protein